MTGIRLTARVEIRGADGTPLDDATAYSINGTASDTGLSSSSHEVAQLGLRGGRVKLSYDEEVGHFWAVAEYESPARLGDEALDVLKDRTNGDWNDGVAAAFFDYLGTSLGFSLWFSWRQPLRVEQYQNPVSRSAPLSALAIACLRGKLEDARAALDAGDDINARTDGLPVLQSAIAGREVQLAMLLIERGADVHARDLLEERRDALRSCATSIRLTDMSAARVARALLERGAVPLRSNEDSPLAVAKRRKWGRLVQVFEEFASTTR